MLKRRPTLRTSRHTFTGWRAAGASNCFHIFGHTPHNASWFALARKTRPVSQCTTALAGITGPVSRFLVEFVGWDVISYHWLWNCEGCQLSEGVLLCASGNALLPRSSWKSLTWNAFACWQIVFSLAGLWFCTSSDSEMHLLEGRCLPVGSFAFVLLSLKNTDSRPHTIPCKQP